MRLAPGVRDDLLAHAREGAPEEVCGVLGGWVADRREPSERPNGDRGAAGDDGFEVETARRVPNVASRPRTEYTLDPEAQFEAMEAIEREGLDVVGFYHSHPRGPTRPSATDAARATWPGYAYLIVVPDEAFVGCWRWTGERFEREDVTTLR